MSVISEPVAQVRVTSPVAAAGRPRWTALLLISLAQLMVVLDTTMASAAAPGEQARYQYGRPARELEVLRLLAVGHGNRDIAADLFISVKTASVHVSNIMSKLGVSTRGEAGAIAHRLGLSEDVVRK
jgi:DNA-binding NarL/FixJ family response regulator